MIPGGVSSPVRSWAAVGGEPFFVARAHGATLTDSNGRDYLDYVQSWGASILGHAHPKVVEAVQRAAADGTSYGAPTLREVELAEAITERVPTVDKVRFVSSGTEAAMTAVRLSRGVTGRAKVVKFAGCYHGHVDALLAAAGSGVATLGLPGSAGVTEGAAGDTIVVPYNDHAAIDAVFELHGPEIAAVIVEPVAANMGLVPPVDGFLAQLRRRCREHGALLVFDEVITGFRVGLSGAQGRFGIDPDLSIFGKVIGGGLPLAAVGGPAALMDELAPVGPVYQAGTLSGNPLATAAGLAVLGELGDDSYVELERLAARLTDGLAKVFADAGIDAQTPRAWTLGGVFFSPKPVRDYDDAKASDAERYARLLPRVARPRCVPRSERVRDDLPEPRPHRRRHRPHDRSGGCSRGFMSDPAAPVDEDASDPGDGQQPEDASLKQRFGEYEQRLQEKYAEVEQRRSQSLPIDVAFRVVEADRRYAGGLIASGMAFRVFVLLVPFSFFVVTAFGYVAEAVNSESPQDVARDLGITGLVASAIDSSIGSSTWERLVTLVLSLYALLWTTWTLIRAMQTVFGLAWNRPPTMSLAKSWRPLLWVVGIMLAMFLGSVAVSALLDNVGLLLAIVIRLLLFGGLVVLWIVVSWLLPRAPETTWYDLLPGAVLLAVGAEVLQFLTIYFFSRYIEDKTQTYGAIGASIAILLWAYLLGRLIVASAFLERGALAKDPTRGVMLMVGSGSSDASGGIRSQVPGPPVTFQPR